MGSVCILGGRLMPAFELSIAGSLPVSDEDVARNRKNARGLGLPTYRQIQATRPRLAVIGGGPSINRKVDEIKGFDGDIWAINGAWGWCQRHGIDATFISADPHPIVGQWCQGAKRALLETHTDPHVFELLHGADVAIFDAGEAPGMIRCGSSTVSCTPHLAVRMGYREVTLYGCESSYQLNAATHAFQHEQRPDELLVVCDDKEYLTAPDYYMQAVELSRYIREVPEFIKEHSGGLLRAMIATKGEHAIRWVSEGLAKGLNPIRPKLDEAAE
jgi:hypothetical protein